MSDTKSTKPSQTTKAPPQAVAQPNAQQTKSYGTTIIRNSDGKPKDTIRLVEPKTLVRLKR